MKRRVVMLLMLLLLGARAAGAQELQPVTLLAEYYVKTGQEGEFLKLVNEFVGPIYEKLKAERAIIAWGVDVPLLHAPESATHSVWYTVPDTGALEKLIAAIEARGKEISEAEQKAAEEARRRRQPAAKGMFERFQETNDLGKHRDFLFRALTMKYGSAPPPAGSQPYAWITVVTVKPGKAAEFQQLLGKYIYPVFDKLMAEGAINGYEMGIEEARSMPATHYVLASLPNLAAREKVRAAFAAVNQARPEEAREYIDDRFVEALDVAATRSFVLRSIVFHLAM
jgi:hypothetical protein